MQQDIKSITFQEFGPEGKKYFSSKLHRRTGSKREGKVIKSNMQLL
jgi:hypothetical protein